MKKKFVGIIMTIICLLFIGITNVFAVTGTEIVNDLKNNYVGQYPYVLYTHGPNSFDCSGLVYYVYKQHGINLPMSTTSDWSSYGTVITDRSQLKDGDILFFGSSPSNISHEGVYDSDGGYIIHALNKNYGIIRKPTLSTWINTPAWNSYGSNQFQFARRVIPDTDPNPPSNAWIRANKTEVQLGESITFEFGIDNATRKYLSMNVNGVYKTTELNSNETRKTLMLSETGWYEVFLEGFNSAGTWGASSSIMIHVTNKTPSNGWIRVDKSVIEVGDSVTFEFGIDNAAKKYLSMNVNGVYQTTELNSNETSKTLTLSETGWYEVFLEGFNSAGVWGASSPIMIHVKNRATTAPANGWIKADKTSVGVGENITFEYDIDNATKKYLSMNKNGNYYKAIESNDTNKKTLNFDTVGIYDVFVEGFNSMGYSGSSPVHIVVTDNNTMSKQTFTVSGNTVTNKGEEQTVTVIVADYTNGVLTDISSQDLTFTQGETKTFSYGNGAEHKIFVWDSINGMKPLCKSE